MRSMHTSFRSVGLRLESLSDRVVPSCTWTQNGTTLTITGDQTANVVDIVDDGTTLTVTCDGQNVPINGNVTDLKISLGSGNDQVTYTLQGALAANAVRNLDVHLGNGNDTFTAVLEDGTDSGGGTVASALGDGAQLNISAYGMNGKDTLSFDGSSTDVGTGSK
ncbi:MAG TPA: hypothetical protein VLM40_02600, partial [Gemmata sp.]|nr:hypothetical protein [Gemmata sp.]